MKQQRAIRLLTAVAGTTVVAAALAGCSSAAPEAEGKEEPQTITLAFDPANDVDAAQWDALADTFEDQNPGVTIERERLPGESWRQVVQTRVQGGNAPDLFEVKSGGGQVGSILPFARARAKDEAYDVAFQQRLWDASVALSWRSVSGA